MPVKYLIVGDMHVQPSNLEESQKLIDFVGSIAEKTKVDRIVFMGDQFHNHSVVRLEVLNFWTSSIPKLTKQCNVVFLVGNHDICGDKEKEREMNANDVLASLPNVIVVQKPTVLDSMCFVPFTSDKKLFIDEVNESGCDIVFCHQTFNGAKYDNGFYAPDGIEQNDLKCSTVFSGHVHTKMKIGKVTYVGSPRWMTASDANVEKSLALVEFEENKLLYIKEIPTNSVCSPIIVTKVFEGQELPEFDLSSRNYIELVGSTAWITKIKKKVDSSVNVKVTPTDRIVDKVRRSMIPSIKEYLEVAFVPIEGVSKDGVSVVLEESDVK